MRKRKIVNQENNLHRWLVSYADFLTLLFATFVILYAVTNVSLEKYKALLHILNIPAKEIYKSSANEVKQKMMLDMPLVELLKYVRIKEPNKDKIDEAIHNLYQNPANKNLNDPLGKNYAEGTSESNITEKKHEDWLEINLRSIFPKASSYPKDEAMPLIEHIANILKSYNSPISVGGYTDNVPIKTEIFPSNWELSASRAAAVVRVLEEYGIQSDRLSAIGYGELHPISSNDTDQGRVQNRRIAILVALKGDLEKKLEQELQPYMKGNVLRNVPQDPNPVEVTFRKLRIQQGEKRLPGDFNSIPREN